MKNIEQIRKYLIDNVFTDPDIMFSDDRDNTDLPEIIASLYEVLHRAIMGEPYEYFFHFANKIGSWVDNDLFSDTEEQAESKDAISREAVLDQTYLWSKDEFLRVTNPFDYLRKRINGLPPIKPQEKTGRWILADEQNKEDVENDNYRFICSECQCSDIHAKGTIVPYCWKCGRRMVDEQERSE